MCIRQNPIKIFFLVFQHVQTGLIAQQQARLMRYGIIQTIQATLTTQLTTTIDADIQYRTPLIIQPSLQGKMQASLRIIQHIEQTWQLGKRHLRTYLLAVTGKIQAVNERSCVHEPRMIYFSRHSVKNPAENTE